MREPNNSDEFILWLFNHRCVGLNGLCYKFTNEINEIKPRSSGDDAMNWRNRVPLCHEHHMVYHANGVSEGAIKRLQERRAEHLEMIGRSEYI